MDNNVFNKDFKTSENFGDKPISSEELKVTLDSCNIIKLRNRAKKVISTKEFPFVTFANFHKSLNSCIEHDKKNDEEKVIAEKNLELIASHLGIEKLEYITSESDIFLFNPAAFRGYNDLTSYIEKNFY